MTSRPSSLGMPDIEDDQVRLQLLPEVDGITLLSVSLTIWCPSVSSNIFMARIAG